MLNDEFAQYITHRLCDVVILQINKLVTVYAIKINYGVIVYNYGIIARAHKLLIIFQLTA